MNDQPKERGAPVPVSRVIWRIVTALLIGGAVYLVTNATHLETPWRLTLSTFIGGAVLVVRFLAEIEDRLMAVEAQQTRRLEAMEQKQEAHAGEVQMLVRDGFAKINPATELFGLVETSALRPDPVIQLVQHSTQLTTDQSSLVSRLAEQEILRTSRFLKELSDGTASYDGEDRDWLLTLAGLAQVSIDATSLNTVDTRGNAFDSSFWQSDLGQRYLRAQQRLTRNGVKIRRIFIVDRPVIGSSSDFLAMCRKQAQLHIEVRILDTAEYEELSDFVLFDNKIAYETIPASSIDSFPGILHTQLQLRPELVSKRVEQYRELWDSARPFLVD
jgi:hypothetical protein